MKRRGFTLIELLAVIVVLAIIALIATPIVMNVISGVQKSAAERSAERYLDAVELAIATTELDGRVVDGLYVIQSDGSLCLEGAECTEKPTIKVEVSGNLPAAGGKIAIQNGQVVDSLTTDSTKKTLMQIENYTVTMDTEGKVKVEAIKQSDAGLRISSDSLNYVTNALVPVKTGSGSFEASNATIDNSTFQKPAIKNLKIDFTDDNQVVSYTFWVRNDGKKDMWLSSINLDGIYDKSQLSLTIDNSEYSFEHGSFSFDGDKISSGEIQQYILKLEAYKDIDINSIQFNYSTQESLTIEINY